MLVLSWPLWVEGIDFPRVPFVPSLNAWPVGVSWVVFVALVAAVVLSGLGRGWRLAFGVSLGLVVILILQDQHRFQPWAYQYVMTGLLIAALPKGEGLRYARCWFVAIYLYAGLSKLDVSFCDELGLVFLRTIVGLFGFDLRRWPEGWRIAAVLAIPVWEIAVAVALAVPRGRRVGRIGALVLHIVLIGILGPLGLGHSLIVLVWNAAMLAEVWLAFGPDRVTEAGALRPSWLAAPVKAVFWAGVLLPLGERRGVFDAWPSHALYASHVERVSVQVHESELAAYPDEVRRHVIAGEGPWRVLDLTGWSRSVRGTPVYPANRACLGLAEGLVARYRVRLVRVVAFGPADRWTGRRLRREATGRVEIRRLGDRGLLNAHPADIRPRTGAVEVSTPPG
jgi:hypothetical protein